MGWRNQMPLFLDMGFRIVCIELMGFGRTEAPPVSLGSPSQSIEYYSFKRAADDIKALAEQLQSPQIIVGGHDWVGSLQSLCN